MEKTDNTPLWVFLAFSSISTRKGALILIWLSIIFTVYCIPWPLFLSAQGSFINKIFINDWSWFIMMEPITIWYLLSLMWMDSHKQWEGSALMKE